MKLLLIIVFLLVSIVSNALTIEEFVDKIGEFNDNEKELSYVEECRELIKDWNDEDKGRYYFHLGYAQEGNNIIDAALDNYNTSIELLTSIQPPSVYLVHSLIDRSYVKYIKSNDVSNYCPDRKLALEIARQVNEPNTLLRSLIQYAFCFENDRQKFREGLSYLDEALDLSIEHKLSINNMAMIHNVTGVLYRNNQVHEKAYEYFNMAYEAWVIDEEIKDMFNMQHAMVGESIQLGNWDLANSHVKKMFEMANDNSSNEDFYFFAYFNKARTSLAQGDFKDAIVNFEQTLLKKELTEELFYINEAKSLLAICYMRNNEIEKSYSMAISYLDSLTHLDENNEKVLSNQAIIDFYNQNYFEAVSKLWLLIDKEHQSRLDFLKNSVKDQTIYFEHGLTEFQNQALEQQLAINTLQLKNEQRVASPIPLVYKQDSFSSICTTQKLDHPCGLTLDLLLEDLMALSLFDN